MNKISILLATETGVDITIGTGWFQMAEKKIPSFLKTWK